MSSSAPEHALERLERTTVAAASPHAVLEAFFDFACGFFQFSALCVVRAGHVEGRAARGVGASSEAVMAVRLRWDPDGDVASAIAWQLGRPADTVRVLIPLLAHGRTVALLYADGGVLDLEAQEGVLIRSAARLASRAFERLLAAKKAPKRRASLLLLEDEEPPSDEEPLALVSPYAEVPFELERRVLERVPISVEITVGSESNFFVGLGSDVSSGGVLLVTYELLEMESHVDLEIALPRGTLQARGAVRWARRATENMPPGLGIAFTEISQEACRAIEQFLLVRPPLYYDVTD
jgi:uncharacterized protein (TIGR02266 family)